MNGFRLNRHFLTAIGGGGGGRRWFSHGAAAPIRHLTKISDLTRREFIDLVMFGQSFKLTHLDGIKHQDYLDDKVLLMLFAKPSLRTRLSLEVAMHELGGKAIYYSLEGQNMGTKESIYDTAKVVSRYVDGVTARVGTREEVNELAKHSNVPVLNALDDFGHPMQTVADFITMLEYLHRPFNQLTMTYMGDLANNVTYDLMRAAALTGVSLRLCGPKGGQWNVETEVMDEVTGLLDANQDVSGSVVFVDDPVEAVKGSDVVYTDSWMSYHISDSEKATRLETLRPYQVNGELMKHATPDTIFMHCLPAGRGYEVTDEVMDGNQSVVFDQAENRLHAQKALLTWLIGDRIKM